MLLSSLAPMLHLVPGTLGKGPNADATAKQVQFSVHVNQTSGTPRFTFTSPLCTTAPSTHTFFCYTLTLCQFLSIILSISHSSLLPTLYALCFACRAFRLISDLAVLSISAHLFLWFLCLFSLWVSWFRIFLNFSTFLCMTVSFSPLLSWPQSSILFLCSFP